MMFFIALVLAISLFSEWCTCEIVKDRLEFLEGYGKVQGRQWSGYVQVPVKHANTTALVHYWLVENEAGKEDAPTIAWFQGGPGGSSLIGLMTEHGPFMVNDFSFQAKSGTLRVFDNPHSWHRLPANMIYIEHPAPTGFSKCEPNPCHWNDTNQAQVGYLALVRLFELYPEFATQRFYMTGESYAGVLVPTMLDQILSHKTKENESKAPWSVRGIALGNACPGNRVFTCTPYSGWIGTKVALDFRYFHGMISDAKYEEILQACEGQWGQYEAPSSPKCRELLEDPIRPVMSEAGDTYRMGGGYFLYDTCKQDMGAVDAASHSRKRVDIQQLLAQAEEQLSLHEQSADPMQDVRASLRLVGSKICEREEDEDHPQPNSGEYFCGQERGALVFLNKDSVQDALHVKRTNFQFSTALDYTFTAHSLLDLYRDRLVSAVDVLQYSGDADPCVPYIGTQRWIRSLGLAEKKAWAPWTTADNRGQPAGYLQVMQGNGTQKLFAFATIRSAGHMSPRNKPQEAFHLMRMFLSRWEKE